MKGYERGYTGDGRKLPHFLIFFLKENDAETHEDTILSTWHHRLGLKGHVDDRGPHV